MKALFFGSIGSIVETSHMQWQAFNTAFTTHGLDWHWELETYADMLKTSGGTRRIAQYAQNRGQQVDAKAIHQTKTNVFLETLNIKALRPRDGVAKVLDQAVSQGLLTGFISTTERATIDLILGKLAEHDLNAFDVVTSRALGLSDKPAPDVYTYAFEKLSLSPSEAVVIEDNLDGVRAAKSAGAVVIGFPGAFNDPTDFGQADIVVTETLEDAVAAARGLGAATS